MSDLIPYATGELERDTRRAGRAISRHRAGTQVRLAAVDDDTDLAMQKVDALTSTTGLAMGAVARVAQVQRQLETLAPEASGRLAFLADSHVVAVGDTVQDLRRDLRRR